MMNLTCGDKAQLGRKKEKKSRGQDEEPDQFADMSCECHSG